MLFPLCGGSPEAPDSRLLWGRCEEDAIEACFLLDCPLVTLPLMCPTPPYEDVTTDADSTGGVARSLGISSPSIIFHLFERVRRALRSVLVASVDANAARDL